MNHTATCAAFAAVALLSVAASAQQTDFSKVEEKVTELGHRTYWIEGAGGNTTVAVGEDAVIMIDGQFAPLHDKLKAAIDRVSGAKPIKYLVNTHYHGDHSGGNAVFAKDGVTVVAQENVKKRLAEGVANGPGGRPTPPAPAEALPKQTYKSTMTLQVKGRAVQLTHPRPAHTDGDTFVWIKDANVLATGDTVVIGRYPNIDYAVGGSIDGMIAAADTYLKIVNDGTIIVPGHGPAIKKWRLKEYRAMLVSARDRVAKLKTAGKSEHEAIAAKPLGALDKEVGATAQQSDNFVRVVYNSLKAKAAKAPLMKSDGKKA
jgi:glyoxylase-like metal-dependent hydrolase (beta-lactamase superfamily II)